MSSNKKKLFEIVEFKGKNWITSQRFQEENKPTESVKSTNKKIRLLPIFDELVQQGHIAEFDWKRAKDLSCSTIKDLISTNSYTPIMLIDQIAEKIIKLRITDTLEGLDILEKRSPLFEVIRYRERDFITSHLLHRDIAPTESVSATNRSIRNMPTYNDLRAGGHLMELERHAESASHLEPLIKANSYRPILLLDAVAQKEAEHHFKVTSTQAVSSSKESAMLGLLGIDLAVLAENQKALQAVKDIHDAQRDGKPLPIGQLKKTPFTKRLDEALAATKKLKQISKALSVPYSSYAILKIVGEEYELNLEGLEGEHEAIHTPQLKGPEVLPALPPCKSEWMLPKDLAKYLSEKIGITFSPQKVNQLLIEAGLQVSKGKNGAGPYHVTERGSEISTQTEVQVTTFKGVKFQTQIHWDKDQTLEEIAKFIEV